MAVKRISFAAIVIGLCVGTMLPPLHGGELRLSGILGQSQTAGETPLPKPAMRGAFCDSAGRLWSFAEWGQLYCFSQRDGRWQVEKTINPPSCLVTGSLLQLDRKMIYIGYENNIFIFDPATEKFSNQGRLPAESVAFAIEPSGTSYHYLALTGNKVMSREAADDAPWTELFRLPTLKEGKYNSLACDPADGVIMVGSGWPDRTIRCFDRHGNAAGNPRPSTNVSHLCVINRKVWVLHDGAAPAIHRPGNQIINSSPWYGSTSGLAPMPDGSWWLATGQGLLQFDRQMRPTGHRLGGIMGPSLLAVGADGTLIGYEDGRMLRMFIDDVPDALLPCHWLEAFRVGANWSSNGCAMLFDGRRFLVLDDCAKKIWSFDPWHTGWGEKTWLPLTPDKTFKKPKSLAYDGSRLFVADADGIVMRAHPGTDNFVPAGIRENGLLAANTNGILIVAAANHLTAYKFGDSGNAELRWEKTFDGGSIVRMAAGEHLLAVATGNELQILSVDDGCNLAAIKADKVVGGMKITSVAVSEPWLFVGDAAGRRILRFHYR